MPRREDIERFTQVLNSLGDEPAIRAARSETKAEAPPGEPGEDLSLDSIPGGEQEEGTGADEQADIQDLFNSLSTLPDETGGAEEAGAPGAGTAPGAPEPGGEGLDFGSLFGEETEPQGIEELDQPAPRSAPAETAAEDELSLPEGDLEDIQSDLSPAEAVPDVAEPSPGIEEDPGEPAPGSFEDLGAFAFDAGEAAAPGTPGEAPDQTDLGGTDLPSLDDLSFAEPGSEPAQEAPGEPGTSEPSFNDASFSEAAAGEPAIDEPAGVEPDLGGGGFDLDAASLGGEETALPEASADEPGLAGVEEMPEPSAEAPAGTADQGESLGEEALGDLDEFSLPESAGVFGVPKTPPPAAPKRAPDRPSAPPKRPAASRPTARPAAPRAAAAAPAAEIALTPQEFARLRATLESLPRNLKIAVQDLIGTGTAQGADLNRLVDLLVAGAAAQEIATLASRIGGKRIRIPAGYEKKTGAALEAEQRTFAYAFRQNILPLVRVVAITLVAGAVFGFLGYRYVYRPLSAWSNYRAGYAQISSDHYALANERFNAATGVWPMKNWYFRFAEGFSDKRQYVLAEEKYEQLLSQFGYDKRALLEYAGMETTKLSDFPKADGLLKRILDRSMYDYDALLATGDNDIEWAATDPTRFEPARIAYATLLNRYGVKDTLLFRMLRYFIRTDNGQEVERLRAYYATKPEVKVDAEVYAELGGYLVDHRRMDFVQQVLFRADKVDPTLVETHYQLARYYRIVGRPDDEKLALDQVVTILKLRRTDAITRKRLSMEIDTHTRLGEWLYRNQRFVEAGKELQSSIEMIERNQRMRLLPPDRMFGRPYAQLGDLYYYVQGDLDGAEAQFHNAVTNLYTSPSLTYKIGYIRYARSDWKGAVTDFTATEDAAPYPVADDVDSPLVPADPAVGAAAAVAASGQVPENLLYALGNTFYQRGDYFAAQGYYLRLLARLETRRSATGTPRPDVRPEDKALLETIARTDNNLGVTLLKLSERTGDRSKRSEGLVYLTRATEIGDSLARNLSSTQRSPNATIAALNMKEILHPTKTPLRIDDTLPRDLAATSW